MHTLHLGDCLDVLRAMPDCSVDSVVTDPPYGLKFMGKAWDYDVPSVEIWAECLRVLKPGGHLLAFAGTRTQHRMACRIEDAGFEIRDMLAWVYGSGFPKSLDVSKAIDRAAGAEREVVGQCKRTGKEAGTYGAMAGDNLLTAPATPEAQQWSGWGTALKPSWECVTMARKPLAGTVAANVLEHGTGALNVDGCRVEGTVPCTTQGQSASAGMIYGSDQRELRRFEPNTSGRWPANLIHDGSEEVVRLFPTDTEGSAARYFYTAKASRAERRGITHPTVKPLDLMAYLCRLVTPPGGIVLDPFAGSGTTLEAAVGEGFQAIGIERDPENFAMAEHRMNGAQLGLGL
jgi:site-specific DNA-methyltransferase (adenine-specific)